MESIFEFDSEHNTDDDDDDDDDDDEPTRANVSVADLRDNIEPAAARFDFDEEETAAAPDSARCESRGVCSSEPGGVDLADPSDCWFCDMSTNIDGV